MLPRGSIHALVVAVLGGLIVGVQTGYVPVALQLDTYITECDRYADEAACSSLVRSGCHWRPDTAVCAYEHWEANCTHRSVGACDENTHCHVHYDDGVGECRFTHGWQAWQQGLFAAMMIVGGMVGCPAAAPSLDRLGRRPTIALLGGAGIVSGIFVTVGWQLNSFALLAVGRLFAGVAVGVASVAAPMYVGEVAPARHQHVIGVCFQAAMTFGIVAAAFIGLVIDPHADHTGHHSIRASMHWLNALCLVVGIGLVPAGFLVDEPSTSTADDYVSADASVTEAAAKPNAAGVDEPQGLGGWAAWLLALSGPIAASVILSASQQLTGINAVMNYAPTITGSMGLRPLLGSFLVMLWNFFTSLGAIPLARCFGTRQLYIGACAAASLACLLTAIPTYPGVLGNTAARDALGTMGIAGFVAAFELGMGPSFYVLAQEIFPPHARSFGCSFTNWTQFVFNLVVNFGYPVAQQGMSGGPSGDQNKGQALCFIIFGILGGACTVYLFFKLPDPEAMRREAGEHTSQDELLGEA